MSIVTFPNEEVRKKAFEEYVTAVGKVAYSWNYLHEQLAQLFVSVVAADNVDVAFAVWYSTPNDRGQRQMLKSAVAASKAPWKTAATVDEFKWLDGRLNSLAEARNDAVHAPCSLYVDAERSVMGPAFIWGHPRAKNLIGKSLLAEFAWCEAYTEALSRYVIALQSAVHPDNREPWPDRPKLPERQEGNMK